MDDSHFHPGQIPGELNEISVEFSDYQHQMYSGLHFKREKKAQIENLGF